MHQLPSDKANCNHLKAELDKKLSCILPVKTVPHGGRIESLGGGRQNLSTARNSMLRRVRRLHSPDWWKSSQRLFAILVWWLFPRLRGFLGACLTIHSPPALFFFLKWRLARTHQSHSSSQDQSTLAQRADWLWLGGPWRVACDLVSW